MNVEESLFAEKFWELRKINERWPKVHKSFELRVIELRHIEEENVDRLVVLNFDCEMEWGNNFTLWISVVILDLLKEKNVDVLKVL